MGMGTGMGGAGDTMRGSRGSFTGRASLERRMSSQEQVQQIINARRISLGGGGMDGGEGQKHHPYEL